MDPSGAAPLIASIEKVTLRRGRDGSGPTWFHPRACLIPGAQGATVFMTLQQIAGSDYGQPKNGIHGDLLMASIRWSQPNRLALAAQALKPGAETVHD